MSLLEDYVAIDVARAFSDGLQMGPKEVDFRSNSSSGSILQRIPTSFRIEKKKKQRSICYFRKAFWIKKISDITIYLAEDEDGDAGSDPPRYRRINTIREEREGGRQ
ncbi:hypothetical protein JTE90_025680 [Oedothorax gibbosus]|uniref:Uncharacterized protein n=1 Tax=Oedothorax gibbosus TaxID=931172 RepID=A0AAV6UDI1_9ARAC|nr:hypothetical protein JTE90_025680 [Oedothorax gibbosus]